MFEPERCVRKSKTNPDAYTLQELKKIAAARGIKTTARDTKTSLCQKLLPPKDFDPARCVRKTKARPDAYDLKELKTIARTRGVYVAPRNTKTSLCQKLKAKKTEVNKLTKLLESVKNCRDFEKVFYTYSNASGRSGNRMIGPGAIRRGLGELYVKNDRLLRQTKGDYIRIYLACVDNTCEDQIAIKVSDQPSALKYEFDINKVLYEASKKSVLRPYKYVPCNGDAATLVDYASNGSLRTYFPRFGRSLKAEDFRRIIAQVLRGLASIQKKYPKFRHNDLHDGNVALDGELNAYLFDFELASIPERGFIGPQIPNAGIYTDNARIYDFHFFLSSMYNLLMFTLRNPLEASDAIRFITRHIPPRFINPTVQQNGMLLVAGFRLTKTAQDYIRSGRKPQLMSTVDQILSDPYIKNANV